MPFLQPFIELNTIFSEYFIIIVIIIQNLHKLNSYALSTMTINSLI